MFSNPLQNNGENKYNPSSNWFTLYINFSSAISCEILKFNGVSTQSANKSFCLKSFDFFPKKCFIKVSLVLPWKKSPGNLLPALFHFAGSPSASVTSKMPIHLQNTKESERSRQERDLEREREKIKEISLASFWLL